MHWSVLAVGSMYDVISSKSDPAIWKGSHLKVSQWGYVDFTVKLFIKEDNITCEFLVMKKK